MRWVVDATTLALYILEREPVSTVQETGWASGPVSMGMEKPRSDTDSNPETSSPQRVAIPNELGWLQILVNSTNDNCRNSIITLIRVVLTNKNCLLLCSRSTQHTVRVSHEAHWSSPCDR